MPQEDTIGHLEFGVNILVGACQKSQECLLQTEFCRATLNGGNCILP